MKQAVSTARWDAELDTDVCDPHTNADLTLTLKLGFRQINPAAGAAHGTYHDYGNAAEPARNIIKWSAAAWTSWTTNMAKSAQEYWHGKFWLLNNFSVLEYEVRGVKYRPNVWCRLKIETVLIPPAGVAAGAHHTIDVVRLAASETWFGSHAALYDSKDTLKVEKGRDSTNKPIMQRAHVHEIGHLLGLGHIAEGTAACPAAGDTNAAPCYGATDNDMRSVMGAGMGLRKAFANPWKRAIVQLTGKGAAGSLTDWAPQIVRNYPRTTTEAVANSHITIRLPRT